MSPHVSILTTLAVSALGTHVVYWLTHARGLTGLRAAGLASLIFAGVAHATGSPTLLALKPAFFGATYCAMTEPHRLSERLVLIAGLVFGLIFYLGHRFDVWFVTQGLGGVLGGSAFVACLLVHATTRARERLVRLKSQKFGDRTR